MNEGDREAYRHGRLFKTHIARRTRLPIIVPVMLTMPEDAQHPQEDILSDRVLVFFGHRHAPVLRPRYVDRLPQRGFLIVRT